MKSGSGVGKIIVLPVIIKPAEPLDPETRLRHHEIIAILSRVDYKSGWEILVGNYGTRAIAMQWRWTATDAGLGGPEEQLTREWALYGLNDEEVVRTAYLAAQQAEVHECQEWFRLDGKSIYSPHTPLKELIDPA
jgi:hypothetical protein